MIEELILVILVVVAAAFYFQFSSTPRPVSSTAAAAPARPAAAKKAAGVASRDLTILYGTQTGTAATFARTLAKDCTRNGLNVAALDADEYDKHDLEAERLVLFVVATYGEGEAPDPMKPFYDWLLDTDGAGVLELSSLKFGVFALGDRGYAHFCEVGKRVDSRMRELGATALLPLRCGDAGSDLEVEFDTWRCEAVAAVCVQLGRPVKGEGDEPVEPECFLRVLAGEKAPAYPFPKAADSLEPTSKQPAFVPVKAVTQLLSVPSDDKEQRSTLHITFEIKGTALTYQGGDHLGVMPRNPDALIEAYLDHLKVDADMRDTLVALADAKTQKNQLPAWVTVRDCLRWHLDLAGRPKRSVLRVFAHYCTDATEKAAMLAALGNTAAGLEQWHHLESKGRTVLGVLGLFPSCAVPLAHFIEAMPRLQARWFSIASDQLRTPHEVSICVAILQGGVCTQMLAAMKAGDVQPLFVRKSNFHLPMRDKARPIVCIGPGTGVAPLIGFMRRREAWAERKQALGPCHLFFGCRNKTEDWLYSEDMRGWHEGKTIVSDLHVAFSRESAEKVYVQHLLAKEGDAIWDAVSKRNANIYICGDAKYMAKDVQATLEGMAQKHGGMSAADASAYFTKLEVDKRIFKDVWSS